MGAHGGFPISERIAARAARETATVPSTRSPRFGAGLGAGNTLFRVVDEDGRTSPPGDIQGFRHFLPAEIAGKEFRIDGRPAHENQAVRKRLRELMARLAKRMDFDVKWPEHEEGQRHPTLQIWENPGIPSGYTYLLQLVAHDLVSTSLPLSILEETNTGVRNVRATALNLDTIYGGGPAACPFAYEPDDERDNSRTALRIGPMKADDGAPAKMRDIVRLAAPASDALLRKGLTEVAIADSRNDDNAIIAQVTVLFHMLHRTILSLLPPASEQNTADSIWEAAFDRFLCARGAVTLIYRQVIRKDLLKRILHPAVYRYYDERPPGFAFLDKTAETDSRIPLEFSHAVFRFGHAMVRPEYQFNEGRNSRFPLSDVLMQTSAKLPEAMPLDRKWIARWSYFFEIEGRQPPNLSRRIGPGFSNEFLHPKLFPGIDDQDKAGLAYRDLLVGGFLNLWSVGGLIETIAARQPQLVGQSSLLNNYRAPLRAFLSAEQNASGLTDLDVEALVDDPPLAFFALWEAAADPDTRGMKLGMLGSIIVAEVIHAAMARNPVTGEAGSRTLVHAFEQLLARTYNDRQNYLDDVGEIDSMEKLIRFVARKNGLESENPGFI